MLGIFVFLQPTSSDFDCRVFIMCSWSFACVHTLRTLVLVFIQKTTWRLLRRWWQRWRQLQWLHYYWMYLCKATWIQYSQTIHLSVKLFPPGRLVEYFEGNKRLYESTLAASVLLSSGFTKIFLWLFNLVHKVVS